MKFLNFGSTLCVELGCKRLLLPKILRYIQRLHIGSTLSVEPKAVKIV